LDENLVWSERLRLGAVALGHECVVLHGPGSAPTAEIAIVNLGSQAFPAAEWIPRLREGGAKVVAHAGHKERTLLDQGRSSGADLTVTNSELTHKLGDILERAMGADASRAEVP